MTPEQLARSGTEAGHQTAVFAWAAMAAFRGIAAANNPLCYSKRDVAESYGTNQAREELAWFHAVPNGGSRGDDEKTRKIRGGQLKAQGVRPGVADTFLPVRARGYAGLYIEMKKPGGKPTKEQLEFADFVQQQGYCWRCCDHWEGAVNVLSWYLL